MFVNQLRDRRSDSRCIFISGWTLYQERNYVKYFYANSMDNVKYKRGWRVSQQFQLSYCFHVARVLINL